MNNQPKIISAVSLCRKAGQLVTGFDAVTESVYKGKAALVLLASDVSEGTKKRIMRNCDDMVPCLMMPVTQLDLSSITYKKVGVYAVTDENLANLCQGCLEQPKEEIE